MLKRNLFLLFSFMLFCFTSTVLCVNNYNPFTGSQYEFIQFYTSFFGATLGIAAIIIYYVKINVLKKESLSLYFWPSVRQGTFISLALTLALFLRGMKMFDLWTVVPAMIIIVLLEAFFQTKKPLLKKAE